MHSRLHHPSIRVNVVNFEFTCTVHSGGRDPEKKDRQEQHRPLVSIKNIDEATL